jgi:hypothetical protein
MMRKNTLVLIIVISGLMFYAGCDDGGGEGQGRQVAGVQCPGGGVPPEECDPNRCPCDFYDVPMTEQCWGSLGISPTFESSPGGEERNAPYFQLGTLLATD